MGKQKLKKKKNSNNKNKTMLSKASENKKMDSFFADTLTPSY